VEPQPQPAAAAQERSGPHLEPGQRVQVPRYGSGIVTSVAGEAITIAFPDGRKRPFLRAFVSPADVDKG
jgi:ATP-dependent DNA helicase RecQ